MGNLLVRSPGRFGALCASVALAHLQSMVRLLSPGGYGLLVSEVCDERTCTRCASLVGTATSRDLLRCLQSYRDDLLFDVFGLPGLLASPDLQRAGVEPLSVALASAWLWRQSRHRQAYFVA